MKYLVILVFQLSFFAANSQDEEWEFAIKPPNSITSYSIYWYPSAKYWLERLKSEKVIVKKVLLDEGREKEIIEYFEGKVVSSQQNFYKDTFLSKSSIKYTGTKGKKTFYYSYDAVSGELVSEKGYEKGKLIYYKRKMHFGDTTEIETVNDSKLFKAKEREVIYYSEGGLTEHRTLYLDNWRSPQYTISKFTTTKQLLERTTQHENDRDTEFYKYDSLGRLIQLERTGASNDIVKHFYSNGETQVEQYSIFSPGDTVLRGTSIERFDKYGKLIYQEVKEYSKNEKQQ